MSDRDCDNCAHHSEGGCSVWECSFEQKDDDTISRQAAVDAICGECQANCIPCEFDTPSRCGMVKAVQALPSAQPTQTDTSNTLKSLDCVERQAAIDVAKAHWYKPDIVGAIEQLSPAEPEPCLDLIVSEIEETIRETKESGKHHEIHVRTNGAMICFGLQLALEIIEEIRNDKAKEDGKTT